MRNVRLALTLLASTALTQPLLADSLSYSNVGHVAPLVSLTAASTGVVMGYFHGADTAGNDFIRLYDVTQNTFSAYGLGSASSTAGQAFNFGSVIAGDKLVFQLINYALGTGLMSSDPSYSADGLNHAYVTAAAASGTTPAGQYIAFEDYLGGFDLDYNDDTFIATNVAVNSPAGVAMTPEPSSLFLLGTGLLGTVAVLRRRAVVQA